MKQYTLTFLVLVACSAAMGAEEETTVEVKDGAVVVKSASGELPAKAGETVVVNRQQVLKTTSSADPSVSRYSSATLTVKGKVILVSSDGEQVKVSNQNGQITIQCGGVTLTGDTATLQAGDRSYDISNSGKVAITIKGGQVGVDTTGGAAAAPGKAEDPAR